MSLSITDKTWPAEFVISEANGTLSRANVTLLAGDALPAGAVLGQITASKKYTAYDPAAVNGSQVARAILLVEVLASAVDQPVAVIDALAEVTTALLSWKAGLDAAQKAAGLADLAARFIKAR